MNIHEIRKNIRGYFKKSDFPGALTYIGTLKGEHLDDAQYLFEKGRILLRSRDVNGAIKELNNSIDLVPDVNKYNLLGRVHRQREEFDKAISCYKKSCAIDSINTAALSELAYLNRVQGNLAESQNFFDRIVPSLRANNIINRTRTAQDHIDRMKARTYLEIGVERGINFFQTKAPVKIAVDPRFKIPRRPENTDAVYFYEVPSDDFFKSDHKVELEKYGVDVALVDGLHTYEQSLRDMVNCAKYLNDGGIIIVHDCYPKNEAASLPDMQAAIKHYTFNGAWNGDVYKAILWLRCNRKDLEVYTLNIDHGLGIIKKGKPQSMLKYTDEQIKSLTYQDFLEVGPETILNLKPKDYELNYYKK